MVSLFKILNMKVLAVTLLALVAVVSSKNINIEDVIDLEDLTAYDYHNKVGIPLADEIRKAEETDAPSRITGGSIATVGQFPYQVGLIIDLVSGSQSVCGGVIVNPLRVLTAAHCCWDGRDQAWRITAVAGSVTLFFGGQRIQHSIILMHANWNPNLIRHNIAMISMASAYSFSNIVSAVALPSGSQINELFVGATATVSGYGRIGDGLLDGITANQMLRHVNVPVINNFQCWLTYYNSIQGTNICTSGAGGRAVCGGDGGGPLTVIRNGRPILVGLNSFGHVRGCTRGHPDVFTRVTSYITWIHNRL